MVSCFENHFIQFSWIRRNGQIFAIFKPHVTRALGISASFANWRTLMYELWFVREKRIAAIENTPRQMYHWCMDLRVEYPFPLRDTWATESLMCGHAGWTSAFTLKESNTLVYSTTYIPVKIGRYGVRSRIEYGSNDEGSINWLVRHLNAFADAKPPCNNKNVQPHSPAKITKKQRNQCEKKWAQRISDIKTKRIWVSHNNEITRKKNDWVVEKNGLRYIFSGCLWMKARKWREIINKDPGLTAGYRMRHLIQGRWE